MNKKGLKTKNWVISVLIILTMVMSAFIGIAGATDDNTNPNNEVDENDVDSTKLGAIVGKVVNSEGDPLARVVVYLSSPISSKPPEDTEQKQVTNERGFFEFTDLVRGEYLLYTNFEGYEPSREMVKVPAGEKVEMKIVLKKVQNEERFSIIYGMVYNALNNKPIGGAIISFFNERSDVQPPKTESEDSGEFKVRIHPGKYVVIAEARGFEPFKDEIHVKEKEMKLEIPLKPINDEEPEPKPRPKRPMLSGHIYDAETDRPIYGWVELSYGNPDIQEPKPQWDFDKDREHKELEELERKELEKQEWLEKEEWKDKKEAWDNKKEENKEELKTRQANNEDPDKNERPERPPEPEKPERPPKPEEPERPPKPEKPERPDKPERPNKPGDYFFWRTYSDRSGFYQYDVVPPGHYEMRVFAPGHRMYYNEITIRDKPQYIDVYLLREPEPKPWSVIMDQVVDSQTKKPVSGAIVCVLPPELILKLRELHKDDVKALGLDMDIDNIEGLLDSDIEIDFELIPEPELLIEDPNIMPPIPPEMIDEELKDQDPGTRGEHDKKEEKDKKEMDKDCDCNIPKKLREYLKKFCTKTDERGMFKLRVNPGRHVLIIKAKGYELFARKFEIGPGQIMKVRIPIKPLNDSELKGSEKAKPESTTEGGNTLDVLGISTGASGTTAALNTTLISLIIIALILGAIVLHRRRVIPKKKRIQK